jgi:hypothetical protein
MTYAIEMGSDAMIYTYTPSFMKILPGIQKHLRRGGDTQKRTHTNSKVNAVETLETSHVSGLEY